MYYDIFSTDETVLDNYPHAQIVSSLEISELKSRAMTSHFFVVESYNSEELIPVDSSSEVVQISTNIRFVRKSKQELIGNNTKSRIPIFVLSNKDKIDNNHPKLLNARIIQTENGLDKKSLEKILNQVAGDLFYVVDNNVEISMNFDFGFHPETYDYCYVFCWNWSRGIRLFSKTTVLENIDNFTDQAWFDGKIELKNIEEDVCQYKDDDVYRRRYMINNDIFVVYQESKNDWFYEFEYHNKPNHKIHILPFTQNKDELEEYIKKHCSTEYFYIVYTGTKTKNYGFDFVPNSLQEDKYIYQWDNRQDIRFTALKNLDTLSIFGSANIKNIDEEIYLKVSYPVFSSYENGKEFAETDFFFVVEPNIRMKENLSFNPLPWERDIPHKWQLLNQKTGDVFDYGGVTAYPKFMREHHYYQYIKTPGGIHKNFDVFFISYDEEFADEHFEKIQKRIPSVTRIHGVKGIHNAHLEAAKKASSKMFYVVDADALLTPIFDFSFIPKLDEQDRVYVWRTKNTATGDVYGYGGVKLLPTKAVLNTRFDTVDFTLGLDAIFVPMPAISNFTVCDHSPFQAYRAAYREAAKLNNKWLGNNDEEALNRLSKWKNPIGKYKEYTVGGCLDGIDYSSRHPTIEKINDFDWLREEFEIFVQHMG